MRIPNMLRLGRFRLVLLAIVAIATIMFVNGTQSSASVQHTAGTFATVNGERTSISDGDILVRGEPLGDGNCSMPKFELEGEMNDDSPEFSIVVEITEDCEAVVEKSEIKNRHKGGIVGFFEKFIAPDVASAATTEYHVKAEYALHDIPHLCLTCSKAHLDYFDDGSQVWGGHNLGGSCGWFGTTGWRLSSCIASSYSINGPNAVWKETKGTFYHLFDIPSDRWDHATFARARGGPGFSVTTCQGGGINPTLTHWECFGSRTPI